MPVLELPSPVHMSRIAIVAPKERLRGVLLTLGRLSSVELVGDELAPQGPAADALRRVQRGMPSAVPTPMAEEDPPDLSLLEQIEALDRLAGEVEIDRRSRMALEHDSVVGYVAWTPEPKVEELRSALAPLGAAVVGLDVPQGVDPPTQIQRAKVAGRFAPLVDTYGVLPYSDVDPTWFAAFAFVVMFGMMFGDLGHGLLVAGAGLLVSRSRSRRLARFRPAAPLLIATGLSGAAFGLAYGEFFGPTDLIPTLWMSPLDDPILLFTVAVIVGSALLAISYLLGSINRWREGGLRATLYAPGGLGGSWIFAGLAMGFVGIAASLGPLLTSGVVVAIAGVVFVFVGAMFAGGGGGAGFARGVVEAFDTLLGILTGAVSFARLAAFGMTHAALGLVIWTGVVGLSKGGPGGWLAALLLFVVGTAITLALEGLVAFVQALRLEYYELFSRVFAGEGHPFDPFTLTPISKEKS